MGSVFSDILVHPETRRRTHDLPRTSSWYGAICCEDRIRTRRPTMATIFRDVSTDPEDRTAIP